MTTERSDLRFPLDPFIHRFVEMFLYDSPSEKKAGLVSSPK